MPVFSSKAFKNNYNYNQLIKKEAKIINEQFEKENYLFALNLLLGNNKFSVNGEQFEFKAFKFSPGRSRSEIGLRENAAELVSGLHEVYRYIPLNFVKIGDGITKSVSWNGLFPNLDNRDVKGEYWTQEKVDQEVAKDFPSTPQDAIKIRIQGNIEEKNEKLEVRKSVDSTDFSSLRMLKMQMRVQYLSEFDEKSQEAYHHFVESYGKNQTSDPEYVKGLDVAEKSGVDGDFVDKAITVIKNKQDEYKAMSGIGRFFSYLNPFQNKFRTARNYIKDMINELSSNTDVKKEDLSNYIYGKSTEKPQIDVPSYEEVAEKNLAVNNDALKKQLEELGDKENFVSLEDNINKDLAQNLGMGETEKFLEASEISSVRNKEDKIDL